jgi:uncharacterized protein DUF5522
MNDRDDNTTDTTDAEDAEVRPLVEGEDYYLDSGLMVLTAQFLTKRGYCCENGCRHCPYGFNEKEIISHR